MKKAISMMVCIAILYASVFTLASCGKDNTDYEHLREVSWEGTELTITLGTNKSTGCEWNTIPEDDSVIGYSVNRVFHLADSQVKEGNAIGSLEAGFEGKGAGTSRVICTTPVGWDGTGDGLVYIVTVTVNEDGTIANAEGEESDTVPADDAALTEEADPGTTETTAQAEETEPTIEAYFLEHPDKLETMKQSFNEDENYNQMAELDVEAKDNTLSFIYKFKETYSDEQVEQFRTSLEEGIGEETPDDLKQIIQDIEEECGVSNIKLYMVYLNGDGTEIYGNTFE